MNKALLGRVDLERKQRKWFMHIYIKALFDPSLLGIILGYFFVCTVAYIPLPTLGLRPPMHIKKKAILQTHQPISFPFFPNSLHQIVHALW